MELQEALEQRYSCRCFTPEALTTGQLTALVEAGRLAPTACNNQPQRVYVVTGAENLAKLDNCTKCRYDAQAAFIVGFDTTEAATHDPERMGGTFFSFGDQDAISALLHMALKATDLGLATCWLGAINDNQLHLEFGIPETVAIRAVLVCGHPDPEKGGPAGMHTKRRPAEETITWL